MFHHRPDRSDLLRSFLDSIGFAIRANCEQITAVSGVAPRSLTLSGGLSRSNALVRRVADIAGIAVHVAREPESAAMGCAILIALGLGTHPSAEAAVESMVEVTEVPPNPQAHEGYQPLYAKWRELYASLEDTSL
jgi:sugar (pentulose or hexulose) kinase